MCKNAVNYHFIFKMNIYSTTFFFFPLLPSSEVTAGGQARTIGIEINNFLESIIHLLCY